MAVSRRLRQRKVLHIIVSFYGLDIVQSDFVFQFVRNFLSMYAWLPLNIFPSFAVCITKCLICSFPSKYKSEQQMSFFGPTNKGHQVLH